MCGPAKLPDDVSEIKLDLKIDLDEIGDYRPRWNAAPTTKLPVVISRDRQRILTLMRWGLVPSWAKDLKIGHSTFNATPKPSTPEAPSATRGVRNAGASSSPTATKNGVIAINNPSPLRSATADR